MVRRSSACNKSSHSLTSVDKQDKLVLQQMAVMLCDWEGNRGRGKEQHQPHSAFMTNITCVADKPRRW